MLTFSTGNGKLKHLARHMKLRLNQVAAFDIPAGFTCPKAGICKTFANRETGKLTRVGHVLCYAAKVEGYAPSARRMRWRNFTELQSAGRNVQKIFELIVKSFPQNVFVMRIHSAGDFFCREYFMAWVGVAKQFPNVTFFAYTKVLDYALYNHGLPNLFIQYSYGSQDDGRWNELQVKPPTCFIGEKPEQYPNVPVVCGSDEKEHEDFFAILRRESFVIPLH